MNLNMKISDFYPIFKVAPRLIECMDEEFQNEMQKLGDELRARHDDAIISDVLGRIEELESENSDETAKILRLMLGIPT